MSLRDKHRSTREVWQLVQNNPWAEERGREEIEKMGCELVIAEDGEGSLGAYLLPLLLCMFGSSLVKKTKSGICKQEQMQGRHLEPKPVKSKVDEILHSTGQPDALR